MSTLKIGNTKMELTDPTNPINALNRNMLTTKDDYKHQDSRELMNILESKGFYLNTVGVARTRKEEKRGFQKHTMMFFNDDLMIDSENRIVALVTNSHSGDSSIRINLGVYRLVCSNGLVVGDNMLEWRVPHRGKTFREKIAASIDELVAAAPEIKRRVIKMQSIKLSVEAIKELEQFAIDKRLANVKNLTEYKKGFHARRYEDQGDDLYRVFNRIQERLIGGGIQYKTLTIDEQGNAIIKRHTTRRITSLSEVIDLNKELWQEAEKLAA